MMFVFLNRCTRLRWIFTLTILLQVVSSLILTTASCPHRVRRKYNKNKRRKLLSGERGEWGKMGWASVSRLHFLATASNQFLWAFLWTNALCALRRLGWVQTWILIMVMWRYAELYYRWIITRKFCMMH